MSNRKPKQLRTNHTGNETWKRHRAYGWDAPACDLDVIEYNYGEPVAIVEDKHWRADPKEGTWTQHTTQKVKRALAEGVGVPFFSRRYWPGSWMQLVIPLNERADEFLHSDGELLTEYEYVDLLYWLRKKDQLPDDLGDVKNEVDQEAVDWCLKHHPNALILDEDFA